MRMGQWGYKKSAIDKWLARVDDPVRAWLIPFRSKMEEDGFRPSTVRTWLSQARLFLAYLVEVRRQKPENAEPSDITAFILVRLRLYRKKRGRAPVRFAKWRCGYTGAIYRLLLEIQGEWPPGSTPSPLLLQFKAYLQQQRFYSGRVTRHVSVIRQFLDYLREKSIVPEKTLASGLAQFRGTEAETVSSAEWPTAEQCE